jgi:RHS repeat-associated protein
MLMMQNRYVYDSTAYYRARYYDPTIGRFISEDPIAFSGGWPIQAQ